MSSEFLKVLALRNSIVAATHEIKSLLIELHCKSNARPEERVDGMGISRLVAYVNELETVAIVIGAVKP